MIQKIRSSSLLMFTPTPTLTGTLKSQCARQSRSHPPSVSTRRRHLHKRGDLRFCSQVPFRLPTKSALLAGRKAVNNLTLSIEELQSGNVVGVDPHPDSGPSLAIIQLNGRIAISLATYKNALRTVERS
jgi:hypothetical protein